MLCRMVSYVRSHYAISSESAFTNPGLCHHGSRHMHTHQCHHKSFCRLIREAPFSFMSTTCRVECTNTMSSKHFVAELQHGFGHYREFLWQREPTQQTLDPVPCSCRVFASRENNPTQFPDVKRSQRCMVQRFKV